MGYPPVFPTGVTVYNPEKSWRGYTLFQAAGVGALLIDMSGREVQLWRGLQGFPNKLLPGGHVFGSTGERNPRFGFQDQADLVQVDFDGNVVWRFDGLRANQPIRASKHAGTRGSTTTINAPETRWAITRPVRSR